MKQKTFLITKDFEFDAAHNLIGYMGDCAKLHGHRWLARITVIGIQKEDGISIDFTHMKITIGSIIKNRLDHQYLNALISQPTAENICIWLWDEITQGTDLQLYSIKLFETPTSSVYIDKTLMEKGE